MQLSKKQNEYIANATHRWNIKSGAVRSGKSYVDTAFVVPFRIRERTGKPGLNVILGVSKESIERNVLQPMREIYTEELIGQINNRNMAMICGEEVYCLGAEKVSQVAKIQGASIKYCYGDEIAKWNKEVCDYDRGRMFTVDAMDNIESAGIAFGRLSGEFLRTQVVPELDTWRLAKYAGYASGNNVVTGAIADGKAGIAAIRAGKTAIKNAEAKTETCYLFISTTLKGMIDDLDTTASKKAMEDWAGVIEVPASRFFDKITLTKTGAGGFATTGGKAIDFLIVDKNAAIQYQKHTVSKIITPEQNQTADAWKFGYRTVGIAEAKDNKKVAIYVHKAGE